MAPPLVVLAAGSTPRDDPTAIAQDVRAVGAAPTRQGKA
jgi:hypothetical protein